MKIASIRERAEGENRVAITPETARLFVNQGYKVFVERGVGLTSNYSDAQYSEAGANVSSVLLEILSDADVILKVQPSPLIGELNEINLARSGAVIIGLLSPYNNKEYIDKSLVKNLTTVAMELVPRITKAQNMDVLTSQSNLAGYRAVIEASYHYTRAFPMMMTAAGTIIPAKVLIIGVGVAGLQAIATAKRLGAVVSAYDVRAATAEQVESLGAKFVYPEHSAFDVEDRSGYAREVGRDFAVIQERFLNKIISSFDIVITTAQIPGQKAPMLLSKEMISKLKAGSVVVDMATSTGGNVENSVQDNIVTEKGVKIIGWSNMAARIANDSSKLYAKNLYNFLEYAVKNNKFNFTDKLVGDMIIGAGGKIINKKFMV